MKWDPDAYLSFERPRLQPALDLISKIPNMDYQNIADLGCGPGNVTQHLKDKWSTARVTGFDSSVEMLRKAKQNHPTVSWEIASVDSIKMDEPLDLIFSNACLQWLPAHQLLFPSLISNLSKNGVFAIQMPNNYDRPTHQLVKSAAEKCGYLEELKDLFTPPPVYSPNQYYDILSPICNHIEIWETDYLLVLEGENPVADWTKGSYLRPFLNSLDDDKKAKFEDCYREQILRSYPKQVNGKTLLPFKRLFILAIK